MTSERKKRRWWLWTLGGIAGVIVLIGVAGIVLLDHYATDIVTDALADADLPNPRLNVESIGLSESRLSAIKLGDDDVLVADRVVLEYDIFDLIDLDLSDLAIRFEHPVLKLAVDADGTVSLGSLDGLAGGGSEDSGGPLPFREIVLDDATLLLTTPQGLIEAQANGTVRNQGEDGLVVDVTVTADNDIALFDGDLSLTVGTAGAIDGSATVRGLDGNTPWGRVQGGSGTLALTWTGDGIPLGNVDMHFQTLEVPAAFLPSGLAHADGPTQLHDLAVDASFDGTAIDASVAAADATGDNAMSLDVQLPDVFAGGDGTIAAEISTNGDRLLWLWDEDWIGDGSLTASIDGTLDLPPLADVLSNPQGLLALPDGHATVQWVLNDANMPGVATGVSSIGDVEIAIVDNIATLTSNDPVELRIDALDASMMTQAGADWEPILQRDMAGRVDIALDGRASRPLSVTLVNHDEDWVVRGDGTVLAATTGGPLAAVELSGSATLGETLSLALEDLSIYVSDVETPAASVGVLELAGRFALDDGVPDFDLAGAADDLSFVDPHLSFPRLAIQLAMSEADGDAAPGVLSGPLTMNFADSGGNIDDVAMTGLSGELTGRLEWDHGLARLYFTENAVFRVESMDIDGDVLIPDPAIVRITSSENPALELDLNDPAGWSLRHSLNIAPLDVRGSIRMGDDRVQTALQTQGLDMEGGYLEGRYVMRIEVAGVSARAPARGWAIGGGNVAIEYDDDDPKNLVVVSANVTNVQSDATAGSLPAMNVRGRMDYGLDDIITVTARTFDNRNLLIADITARHDVNTNVGRADVEVQDLIFNPVVLQPSDISPLLSDFENVTGTADIEGGIRWSGSTITPDLALLISDVTGEYDDVEFERMNAVVQLQSVAPLATKPDQLLSIASVDPGVPINNAQIQFAITGGDTLNVKRATFDLADGVVSADDQVISFSAEEQEIDLVVTGVDLDALLAFADLETMEAEGTLDGVIPIRVVDGDVVIPEAYLEARGPGFIRYDSSEDLGAVGESNAGIDLMVELLKNFLYDELTLRMTRPVAGDMQVGFRILGRNPDVYGGVPIDLSLNVDGELEDVIRNSLDIYRVPETIQELILQYGFDAAVPPG